MVLPALTVALPWAAWYGIVLRSNMLDTVSLDYARTAAAKGLGPWIIAGGTSCRTRYCRS